MKPQRAQLGQIAAPPSHGRAEREAERDHRAGGESEGEHRWSQADGAVVLDFGRVLDTEQRDGIPTCNDRWARPPRLGCRPMRPF